MTRYEGKPPMIATTWRRTQLTIRPEGEANQ